MIIKAEIACNKYKREVKGLESRILKDGFEKLEQMTRVKTKCKITWNPKKED